MKKRFVITSLPIRLPIQSTILYSFLLHYFKADGIYWGIFITLYSILWILVIAVKSYEVKVDLNSSKEDEKIKQSKFAEKLKDIMNKNI